MVLERKRKSEENGSRVDPQSKFVYALVMCFSADRSIRTSVVACVEIASAIGSRAIILLQRHDFCPSGIYVYIYTHTHFRLRQGSLSRSIRIPGNWILVVSLGNFTELKLNVR